MERVVIPFTTEEAWLKQRTQDLTSSDIGTLFGCGYLTYDELLEQKRNAVLSKIEKNERMLWGLALEPAIAQEFARQNNWTIKKKTEYIRLPEHRIGSSFDYEVIDKDEERSTNGLLEIKNVDSFIYKKDWITKGFEIEAPVKIELQLQNELLVSGLTYGWIGACVGGNQGVCLFREANKKVHEAILKKAKEFWEKIDELK